MMTQHKLSNLDSEQLRGLLTYYRQQEAAGSLAIKASEFQDGELLVVNYTDQFNEATAPDEWDWRMELARGSVFFKKPGSAPEVVVRAMPKFHGYTHCPEALGHIAEDGPIKIMRKHDGSCISITCFRGEVLLFTRGARHSFQTQLARELLSEASMAALEQLEGHTFAAELIHKRDGKVEENRGPDRLVLLYACEAGGRILPVELLGPVAKKIGLDCVSCKASTGSDLMIQVELLNNVNLLEDMREGFVIEISGKKYKVKPQIYKTVAGNRKAPPVPQPNQAWMARCFLKSRSIAEVQAEVEKMLAGPLNYGALAKGLFDESLKCVEETIPRLRSLHSQFPGPKQLNESQEVAKTDKLILFPCLKLPESERDAWFDQEGCRFAVAQSLAKRSLESMTAQNAEPGFTVGKGRLILCGAPSRKDAASWAEGLNSVVTLLRDEELHDRGLDLASTLANLKVEWLHLPISGAALQAPKDHDVVMAAARAVAERLRSGRTVAVHCSAGLHRTGIVAYLGLRLLGRSRQAALELLGQIRWQTRAELEKIYYRSQSTTPDTPGNLLAIAEDLLRELTPNESA